MHPRLRLWIVGTVGAVLGIAVAFGIADESYLLVRLVALIVLWVIAEWINGALPEAWLLAWVLLGYIIGNRGFAQTSLLSNAPLFPAEAVLLAGGPGILGRMAFGRVQAFYHDRLNYALVVWLILGTARLSLDVSHFGILAVRDFAMVYYAAFFFLAQACAGHAASFRLLRATLTLTFIALPAVAAIEQLAPGFFLTHFTIRGIPLIFHKTDLLAAYLACGFFWLWTRWEKTRVKLWLLPTAACLLTLGTTASSRAAMVALALVTLMWLFARRWRIAGAQLLIVGAAASAVVFVSALSNKNLQQTAVYSTYEHALSIFDLRGTGTYVNEESGNPGLNNRFRITWWHTVIEDTVAQNPVFGLGFGYDLAAHFLVEYELLAAEDFTTRSPHSMIVSVFGRMGAVGLAVWLAIAVSMAHLTYRAFRSGNLDAMGLVCIAWVLWFSACVGVVLEGPMGAVVFWVVLGVANRHLTDLPADETVLVEDLQPAIPADEVAASP
ncbi:MAG: O-antigen ligase family protein [Opitutaceae bacterium]